jgi:hypothetical protein
VLDTLAFFLMLWVVLIPDRLGYDEGASRRSYGRGKIDLLQARLIGAQ